LATAKEESMGRKRVSCVVLECDRCGLPLEGDEPFVRHYRENQVRLLEAEAESFGWSSDGRGRWHCAGCPALEDESATGKVAVMPGQAELDEELGVDVQERLLRKAGLLPWAP
jgi:hypothetical protein